MMQIAIAAITRGTSIRNKNASPINTGRKIAKNFTLSMIPLKNYFEQSILYRKHFVTTLYNGIVAFNG